MAKVSFAIVVAAGAGVVALTAQPSFAGFGGTISSGTVIFERTDTSFDSTPQASLTGVSFPATQDFLFESGWAFRVAGDSHETFFGVPNSATYVGDHSDIHWNDVGGRGLFSADEHSQVSPIFSGGFVVQELTIVNLSGSNALNVHIFHMADIDLQPNFPDDVATLAEWTPNRVIGIDDPGFNTAAYLTKPSAAGFLVRTNGAGDVGELLADAAITTFDNSGLPYGPGDLTAGYDFPFVVPPLDGAIAFVYILVNIPAACDALDGVFCDGLEIGNRSVWSSSAP